MCQVDQGLGALPDILALKLGRSILGYDQLTSVRVVTNVPGARVGTILDFL